MSDRCPFCFEDVRPDHAWCPHCEEPLTAEAEMALAPEVSIRRERELRAVGGKGSEAMAMALLGAFCCGFIGLLVLPIAIAMGSNCIRVHRKHGADPPVLAFVAVGFAWLALAVQALLFCLAVVQWSQGA